MVAPAPAAQLSTTVGPANGKSAPPGRMQLRNEADWIAHGVSLRVAGHTVAALVAYQRALEFPNCPSSVWTNIGNALRDLRRFDEAATAHRRAIDGEPTSSKYHANLGVALRDAGAIRDALDAYERAVELDPDNALARFDQAQLYLMLGDYKRGWPEFEWRWRLPEAKRQKFRQPAGDGRPQPDKTILLWPEQGFGDTILSARFIPLLRKKFAQVVLCCQPELLRLFQRLEGIDAILPYGSPKPRTARWILVLSPPRERPMAES